eukprot:5262603-Pleurochrysis_carterae.AAC.7
MNSTARMLINKRLNRNTEFHAQKMLMLISAENTSILSWSCPIGFYANVDGRRRRGRSIQLAVRLQEARS